MAEYTNLTSLDGLQTGDVVTYDATTAIDFKGYKVKVELYGKTNSSTKKGGHTTFVIDTSLLPQKILSFNKNGSTARDARNDLIYGDTDSLYYRIAVAGNAGSAKNGGSGNGTIGAGGGLTGGNGGNNYYSSWIVNGATQTAGGSLSKSASNYNNCEKVNGSFGYGADRITSSTSSYSGYGGYGWYGGGTAECSPSGSIASYYTGGSGGSGFIIGVSTTTYPTGYLGDDTTLQSTIAAAITEGVLTQGGSTETTPKMVLTIVEVGDAGSSQSIISYYNGNEFINTNAKYYNGSKFIDCDVYYYDGTEFKKI